MRGLRSRADCGPYDGPLELLFWSRLRVRHSKLCLLLTRRNRGNTLRVRVLPAARRTTWPRSDLGLSYLSGKLLHMLLFDMLIEVLQVLHDGRVVAGLACEYRGTVWIVHIILGDGLGRLLAHDLAGTWT